MAAGEGKRMGVDGANKTTVMFEGKPLIQYGVDLYKKCVDEIYIVVGAHKESVEHVIADRAHIHFVEQSERKGTGHALITALNQIQTDHSEPELVLVGYGDHMMFYNNEVIDNLIALHRKEHAVVSLISTKYKDPDYIAWGRIIRDKNGKLINIIEQNDATIEERKIEESNAGFYCIDFRFAMNTRDRVLCSKTAGEYYVNDFTYIALGERKQVSVLEVPFAQVGIGVNNRDQFSESTKIYRNVRG